MYMFIVHILVNRIYVTILTECCRIFIFYFIPILIMILLIAYCSNIDQTRLGKESIILALRNGRDEARPLVLVQDSPPSLVFVASIAHSSGGAPAAFSQAVFLHIPGNTVD